MEMPTKVNIRLVYIETRPAGFEPANTAVKMLCLTTWLWPYFIFYLVTQKQLLRA